MNNPGAGPAPAEAMAADLLTRCRFPDPRCGPVALAVSGGPDSLALLVLAARFGLETCALHVDHGLREGSPAEADVVRVAAARFGARFESLSVSVGAGGDLEARARAARYAVLPAGVLTGHTMDDQAETVLLNVIRGAALDGLTGIGGSVPGGDRARQVPTRPLLGLRRSETVALCGAFGLEPVADPTNSDSRFRRNRVRAEVIPLLCDVAERDVVPVLARQAEILAAERDFMEGAVADIDPTDTRSLREVPAALASRALRAWIRADGLADGESHPPSAAEMARVLEVVRGAVTACELSGGRRIERSGGRLRIVPNGPRGPGPFANTPGPAARVTDR